MTTPYLNPSDEGVRNWADNFSSRISAEADPGVLGLDAVQVSAYAALQMDYDTKFTLATQPTTRGGATILAKNLAKKPLVSESRKLAMIVTNHPGVTDQQRYDLGLTVRDNEPTPVPVPSTAPTIDVKSMDGWTLSFRLHDGDATSRAKPTGVKGATIFSYVGDEAPVDVEAWKFEGNITKTDSKVVFPSTLAPGTKVFLTAFWFNTRAESGPAAMPVSRLINYGGMSQAA